jgi:hypothetical protein
MLGLHDFHRRAPHSAGAPNHAAGPGRPAWCGCSFRDLTLVFTGFLLGGLLLAGLLLPAAPWADPSWRRASRLASQPAGGGLEAAGGAPEAWGTGCAAPAGHLQLAKLRQEAFCADVHPLAMPGEAGGGRGPNLERAHCRRAVGKGGRGRALLAPA